MNNRNKQIHFLPSISVGGAPINALRLITELKKINSNCTFEIWSPNDNESFKERIVNEGIKFVDIRKVNPFSLPFLNQICSIIFSSKEKSTQFITHGRGCGLIIKPLILISGKKSVHFYRGFTPSYGIKYKFIQKFLTDWESILSKFGIVICVGAEELKQVRKTLNPRRYELLYNPVKKINWERNNNKNTFCFIGRRSYQKGFDRALKVSKNLPDISFTWFGEQEKNFRKNAVTPENMNLASSDNIENIFSKSNVVIILSRWEGASTVAIECLLSKKPFLSINCPGVNEFFYDGFNDINKFDSLEALEEGIKNFDLEFNLKLSEKLYTNFKDQFDSAFLAKRYAEICKI